MRPSGLFIKDDLSIFVKIAAGAMQFIEIPSEDSSIASDLVTDSKAAFDAA